MSWMNTFFGSDAGGVSAPADPSDDTVIRGAPYDARKAIRSGAENPVAGQDPQIAEEIKRRQIAIVTRYVATVRAL
jgi:hypothetical protein